jgi:hypothetical protein
MGMLPAKTDPKWTKFVTNLPTLQVTNLPARMLVNRLKLKLGMGSTDAIRKEIIDAAYEFFSKNETAVADDIKKIFG